MKKVFSFLLAAAFAASCLTACGGGAGNSASNNGASGSETSSGSNTVSIWCWDETFNIPAAEKAAEIYREKVPDFELEITNISFDDIVTRLTASMAGGQTDSLPDIMLMSDTNIKKFVTLYPGYFADLTDSGIDFSQFAQYKVEAGTVDGKIYAVPFDNATSIAAYRTDMLEQAGLTLEDLTDLTWDEFIEIAKPVVEETGIPMLVTPDNVQLVNCMLQSSGNWYFDENDEVNFVDNEGMRELFQVYKELTDSGILQIRNDMESYYSSLYDSSCMGTMNACWIMNTLQKDEANSGNWGITNMPRFGNIEGATNAGNTGGSSWVVLDNDNKELAIDYLNTTFAGSAEMYNDLLNEIAAVATYLPAKDQPNYTAGQDFYGGQAVFAQILEYSNTVPRVNYGVYTAEAADAIKTALTAYRTGQMDLDAALTQAEENVAFLMQ